MANPFDQFDTPATAPNPFDQFDVAQIPGAAPSQVAPAAVQAEPGLPAQAMRQLGLTARMGAEGLAGGLGVITDPIAALVNQLVPPERRLQTLRSVVSTLLTEAGVPQPETAIERVVQEAGQSLVGGGAQLGLARQIPAAVALTAAPGAQLAGAAGAGGAAQTAAEAGLGPGAQLAAGLAGGTAAGIGAGMRRVPGQAAEDIAAAEQAGVRLMTSDVRPPTSMAGRAAEQVGLAVPATGTRGVRAAQQTERVEATNKLLADYGYPQLAANLPEQLAKDIITKRGADLKRLTTARDDVLTRVTPAGAVPTPRTAQAIQDEIAKLQPAAGDPAVDRVIADLQDLGAYVQGRDLQGLEVKRRVLRDQYADPALANVKSIGEGSLNRLYSTLVGDMGEFIKANGRPTDYNKWRVASTELGDMAKELNSTALKAVLRRGDVTPEVVTSALFNNKPSEVKLVYKSLSPQGRELAKTAVLSRAAERASELAERGAERVIDPTKFADEVQKLGDTIGIVFQPKEAKRIESMVRVLNLTRGAQSVAEPVQILSQQVPVGVVRAAGAGAVALPVLDAFQYLLGPFYGTLGAVGAGLSLGAAARAYESAPVRNLLDRIATTRPGSPQEAQLVSALSALRIPAPQTQE